jgi:hypothetical protein
MLVASRAGAGQNGHVYMSPEFIAVIGIGVTSLVTTLGGFAWLITRMDGRFAAVEAKIAAVKEDIVEIKVSVARIEGPRPRLIAPR